MRLWQSFSIPSAPTAGSPCGRSCASGFQPILPFRGVRTFSNVDDGAMARKLDFFRRFEAGELTVAYTNEWSRLVNTPSSESEPATDEGGWSTDEEGEESEED